MPMKPPRAEGLPRIAREENFSRGPHTLPPPRYEPEHETTLHGAPAPPPGAPRPMPPNLPPLPAAPAREKLDSREVSTETLLEEYKGEADARRAAEAREAELRIKLAAAESGVTAQGPKLSLGSARWWVLIIAALAAVPQIRDWARPEGVTGAQLEALRADVQEVAKGQRATADAIATRDQADAKRWTMQLAFQCAQGFRARGADCAAAEAYADFQAQPLKPNGSPQWKANTTWPAVPVPKD